MNKKQMPIIKRLLFVGKGLACFIYPAIFVLSSATASAQDLSISIAPPISTIKIRPGTEFTLRYLITNNSNDVVLKTYIQPFEAWDDKGNVSLVKKIPRVDLEKALSWFAFNKPHVNAGETFPLGKGMTQEINLKISPDADTPFGDYYFTLVFETQNPEGIGGTTVSNKAIVGSNILMTVTNDVETVKLAKIAKFEAPTFVDSFSNIDLGIIISNTGQTLFQPIGEIKITTILGKEKGITLAPQNILADSKREIFCLEGEEIIPCSLKGKFLFGIYKEKISFRAGSSPKMYEEEKTTIALPFSLVGGSVLILVFYKMIKPNLKKEANPNLIDS